jgi:intracellular septation protein
MMESAVQLPDPVWARLNLSWVAFFLLLGLANLYVVYHFDTATWVNFKLFGLLGLTLAFVLGQGLYLARYMEDGAGEKK